jgi:hypothetical protein
VLLLRASSQHEGNEVDLNAIIGNAEGDGGIAHGDLLGRFAEAVVVEDAGALNAARQDVLDALGLEALVDACGVAAAFNAIDRVADATGIPIDEARMKPTADFRESLGINAFPSGKLSS